MKYKVGDILIIKSLADNGVSKDYLDTQGIVLDDRGSLYYFKSFVDGAFWYLNDDDVKLYKRNQLEQYNLYTMGFNKYELQ